jgi:hypothetical protein
VTDAQQQLQVQQQRCERPHVVRTAALLEDAQLPVARLAVRATIDAAVATGPSEVIGHRRVVIRTTGGAEYLSLEVLVRQRPSEARTQELRAQLEQSIKGALPELVVSVRVRVGELPPPGPEDPTRQLDDTRTLLFDERASLTGDQQLTEVLDDNPTELIDEQPTEAVDAPVFTPSGTVEDALALALSEAVGEALTVGVPV